MDGVWTQRTLYFSYLALMKIRSLLFWFFKYYVYATCLFFRNVESEVCERHDLVGLIYFFIHLLTPCSERLKPDHPSD